MIDYRKTKSFAFGFKWLNFYVLGEQGVKPF